MRHIRLMFVLALIAFLAISAVGAGAEKEQDRKVTEDKKYDPDVELLKEARIGTDGPSLLAYLKKLTRNDEGLLNLDTLLKELGDKSYKVRKRAQKTIIALGPCAIQRLLDLRDDPSPEVGKCALTCLEEINTDFDWGLGLAAVRRLAKLNPIGAVETLLRFLPYAASEATEVEIWYSLDRLAFTNANAHQPLVKALKDAVDARRAVAGCIIGRRGTIEERRGVLDLLHDHEPLVRLRAAQGLLAANDRSALLPLIALLDSKAVALAWQAEELLRWAAGSDGPDVTLGSGSLESRKRCTAAWRTWWHKLGHDRELVRLKREHRQPGLFLVLAEGAAPALGKVTLFGFDGMARWELKLSRRLGAAQFLRCARLLTVEEGESPLPNQKNMGAARQWAKQHFTCERNLHGRILREQAAVKTPFRLVNAGHLPNGAVFVASTGALYLYGPERSLRHTYFFAREEWMVNAQEAGRTRIVCGFEVKREKFGLLEIDARTGAVKPRLVLDVNQSDNRWKDPNFLFAPLSSGKYLVGSREYRLLAQVDRAGQQMVLRNDRNRFIAAMALRSGNTLIADHVPPFVAVREIGSDARLVSEVFLGSDVSWIDRLLDCFPLVRFGFDVDRASGLDPTSVANTLADLRFKNPAVRQMALGRLRRLPASTPELLPALIGVLADADNEVRKEAERVFGGFGRSIIPSLLKACQDESPRVRASALRALACVDLDAQWTIPALLKMLKDKDLNVRESALLPLVKLGGNEKEVLEALISSLRDREPKVAIEAARLLEPYGQKAEAAIPDLVRCLKSTDSGLRDQAALALGPIGGKDKKVLKTLITVLKDRGPMENRNALAMALGKLGTEAEEAIPTLIKALDVSDMKDKRRGRWTRLAVISAIGRIGRPVTIVVPLLLGIVKDAQADVNERVGAVNGLERIGPVAKQAVPELTRLLRSTDDTLLRAAVERAIKAIHNPEKQQ